MTPNTASANTSTSGATWWRLPLLLAVVLATLLLFRSLGGGQSGAPTDGIAIDQARMGQQVSLTVDSGDGSARVFAHLPWRDGMTVADLLTTAGKLPDGPIFAQRGTGQAALLMAIDGVENQGATGNNWTFAVNGQRADRSFAIYTLRPGDSVLWEFAPTQ